MTKKEFDKEVRARMKTAANTDAERLVAYYDELFADKLENGEKEEDIIAGFGGVDEIVANYVAEMELSPIGKFVKKRKRTTASWFRRHTEFLHNRTFWLVYFAGFVITFPLTAALLGVCIGLLGASIGVFAAVLVLYVTMYALSVSLPLYGIWGVFTFVFDAPRTFAIGSVSVGMCLFSFGAGLFMIALTITVQKQINKLFHRPNNMEVNHENKK